MYDSKDTRISVFGSTGFVGSSFCHLYKDEVIEIPRDDYEPKSKNVLYLIGTTNNYNVFTNPQLDIDTNLTVLINVLEKCKDKDLVFNLISSGIVYGDCELPAKEDTYCHPKGFYAITKKCAEDLLISYCLTFHISYRILRLGSVYGKGDVKTSRQKSVLKYLIEELKNNRPIKLYHDGNFKRDYMHVNDVARAIKLVVESAPLNSIINIGSGIPYRFRDLIEEAQRITGSQSEIKASSPPEFHTIVQVKDMFLDVERLKSLGFKPTITIEEGIAELCRP
ncbi:MAG: NAD-dependent epimerase/dehydratase family protein [Xenococcaceae cyanobacterium]